MAVTPTHRVYHKKSFYDKGFAVATAGELFGTSVWLPGHPSLTTHDDPPTAKLADRHWSREPYVGFVYCATVTGGQLYVRGEAGTAGYWSGNSERAGIDVRLAYGTRIGSDGKIYQLLKNRETGNKEWVSPTDLQGKTLKLPE